MSESPTVYVSNMPAEMTFYDWGRLSNLGALSVVTRGKDVEIDFAMLAERLIGSRTTDLLCLVGDPFMSAMVLEVWIRLNKEVQLVRWSVGGWHITSFDRGSMGVDIERALDYLKERPSAD